uniref:Putative LOC100573124 [Acyrthosiphon pisum] n=1 Tax=Lepeophtheirus salmonis TaxID=72036 RepID=A0A0K2UQY8_LEPSM
MDRFRILIISDSEKMVVENAPVRSEGDQCFVSMFQQITGCSINQCTNVYTLILHILLGPILSKAD